MNQPINFTPAASVTIQTPAGPIGATFAMPAVDSGNVDLQVIVAPGCKAFLAFGSGAKAGPRIPMNLMVRDGSPGLLTANAAILATGRPVAQMVAGSGTPAYAAWSASVAGLAAAATSVAVVTDPPGGSVTITRGTAALATQY